MQVAKWRKTIFYYLHEVKKFNNWAQMPGYFSGLSLAPLTSKVWAIGTLTTLEFLKTLLDPWIYPDTESPYTYEQ